MINKLNNQKGLSLILSVVTLTSLMGLVISVANSDCRITKTNQAIGASEVAFYAAESAAELVLYDIEKNGRGLDIPDKSDVKVSDDNNAVLGSRVRLTRKSPARCATGKQVCSNNDGEVTTSNSLIFNLKPNQTFQFDFSILGADYPTKATLHLPSNVDSNIIFTTGESGTQSLSDNTTIKGGEVIVAGETNSIDPSHARKFRVTNIDSSSQAQTYTLQIEGSINMPMGLIITTTGTYQGATRKLEIIRPAWLIY